MDERAQAIAELEALVQIPGALRIITNEHVCGGGLHPDIAPFDQAACAAYPYPLTDPRHFRVLAVNRLEGPNHNGQYTAVSDEGAGAYTVGQPDALLTRLRDWRR